MRCDLHMHSTHSDGSLPVAELVPRLAAAGVSAFALTDHNTVDGVATARELGEAHGLRSLAGIEVSTTVDGMPVHMLGYGFDPDDAELGTMLTALNQARHGRIPAMVERLCELGAEISVEAVMAIAGDGSPGRPHVARALVEAGHCEDIHQAFGRYLGDGKPAHVKKRVPSAFEAIEVLRKAGGKPVWAHPLAMPVQRAGGVAQLASEMKRAGLAGIEVVHPGHQPEQRRKLRRLCRDLDLLPTGGSDFHSDDGYSLEMREPVPVEVFEALAQP